MNKMFYKITIAFFIIVIMISASIVFNSREIILPEIAALVVGCLVYQNPIWLSKPLDLFLLPSITAILGFFVNMIDVGLAQKLVLILLLMFFVLKIFKSSLAPALATGLLPIITNASSYYFIISILLLSSVLSFLIILENTNKRTNRLYTKQVSRDGLVYILFIAVWVVICDLQKWMFMAALPPVIVTGYEAVHKQVYEGITFRKQVVCLFLAAFVGIQALHFLNNLVMVVMIDMFVVSLILRIFKCRLPPAYAMAILPMVLNGASYGYFHFQVLLMSVIIFGAIYLYKNSNVIRSFRIFSSEKNQIAGKR